MRVIVVVITAVVLAAAALAAQAQTSAPMPLPMGDSAAMVLSGAALLAAGSALKRVA